MLNDVISSKKSLFADDVQTVLRGQENRNRNVALLKGNLVGNTRSESRGVNARVYKNGLYGFSSMAEYSAEAAETVLRAATENALFLGKRATSSGIVIPSYATGTIPMFRNIVDTEQKRIIDVCKEVDAYIEKTYPKLISRVVSYAENSQDKIIVTNDAFSGHATNPRCFIFVVMTAEGKDGAPLELFKPFGGAGSFDDYFSGSIDWMKPGIEQLYNRLMDKTEGVYAEAGLKTVILGPDMAGMLSHEAVGHTVEADLVIGGSVAGPSLNRQVASEKVTLVDYANKAFGETAPLPVDIDDEGIKAEDVVLIKDGILTGYMHNRETAERFGVKPAGNARGWAFSDEPLIRMRNTCITPGTDKLEDMIASIDDGYYLLSSGNGQADLTGEFMFGVTMGYEIKHGKLGRALLDTTVSGIAFEMLKTVDMISDTVEWTTCGFCGKKQMMTVSMGGPSLRCKMMIGGR